MPDWDSIVERSAVAAASFHSLSPTTRYLLLDLLDNYADRWRFGGLDDATWDDAEAALSLANLELMQTVSVGGGVILIGALNGEADSYRFEGLDAFNPALFQLEFNLRTDWATSNQDNAFLVVNDDTAAHYGWIQRTQVWNSATVTTDVEANDTAFTLNGVSNSDFYGPGMTSQGVLKIPTALSTGGYTRISGQWQLNRDFGVSHARVYEYSGYMSVVPYPIENIELFPVNGDVFQAISSVRLYAKEWD